jgi:hypothetical protein
MARIFSCLALVAVAVSAVNLEHKNTQSAFGQTVLAQLQNKISQGTPADELNSIIEEIRKRLTDAQNEDGLQSAEYHRQCVAEDAGLAQDIINKNTDITNKLSDIDNKESEIRTLTDHIAAYADKIIRDQATIDSVDAELSVNEDEWAQDQALYKNRTDDTNTCIEAINEIRQLDLGKLKSGQEDDATDYQRNDIYNEKLSLFQKLSTKVHDKTVLAFVETTSLAMAQMTKGQIEDLESLLTKLEQDLENYLLELTSDNGKNFEAYKEKKLALGAELADATATKAADTATHAQKQADKQKAQQELKVLDQELASERALLLGLQNEKVATAQKCSDLAAAFSTRSSERSEELDTLAQIEQIIADKLGATLQTHVVEGIAE